MMRKKKTLKKVFFYPKPLKGIFKRGAPPYTGTFGKPKCIEVASNLALQKDFMK